MITTTTDSHLVVGDADGFLFVFTIHELDFNRDCDDGILSPIASWKGHKDRIMSAAFVESPEELETYLISTSEHAEIFMWNLLGEKIGIFGGKNTWNTSTLVKTNDALLQQRAMQIIPGYCEWFPSIWNFEKKGHW